MSISKEPHPMHTEQAKRVNNRQAKTSSIDQSIIIQLIQSGDKKGLDLLYKHYSAALYGVIFRMIKNDVIAEEVLQDVFVKIWKSINQYNANKGRLFTWMHKIAVNKSLDKLRSKEMNRKKLSEPLTLNLDNLNLNFSTNVQTDHLGLENLLSHLKPRQKKVMHLIYFQGFTHSETAKECNMPLGTVKTLVRSGLQSIKTMLKSYPEESLCSV